MKPALVASLLLCLALPAIKAQPANVSELPQAIQELAARIQGKSPAEVHAAIIKRFGAAQRNVGSGIRIELWHLPEGELTFHPGVGPTFSNSTTKQRFWLLRTTNPVASNVLQSYEMLTLADPANHGSQFWLGNLEFGSNSTYRFIDSGQNLDHRAAQTENFFLRHPSGIVEVRYVGSNTPDTELESVAEGTTVAHLVFTSSDHKHTATFFITSSERERRLVFGADEPLSFHMATGWQSYWR
jgi:hypothetical protein